MSYGYSARNERVKVVKADGSVGIHFYGVEGLLYGVYKLENGEFHRIAAQERVYFGGRLTYMGGEKVITDRLGSVVKKGSQSYRYFPYGQENGTTPNDAAKYATYTRDASTGLDYARNRYYTSTWGRFTTADPYRASGGAADPQSWNRYAYVEGDPVNHVDRAGLITDDPCFEIPGCQYQISADFYGTAAGAYELARALGIYEGGLNPEGGELDPLPVRISPPPPAQP